ncbi:zinc finger MYM-type protein 1-like [Chrysoperla carnea]|uniref:zinc finger MYM-type protein 1-like n=1 Tax=Chrysoperla carnea TaxID=189513 RepID=UPI001D073B3B|nr:zinc finger MYM-type protein 1-like [Chrysoperla carnea]
MIGKFDDVMADHINRIQQSVALKNHMPHYAGNRFQNEIISILAAQIQKYILSAIKDAKYFSVILDCTPDMGHVEQITIILRYVHIQNDEVEVRENFVGFSPAQKSTGEAFYDFLIEKLSSLKLNVNDMRGQGYDNGSNMAGKHIGLQKRILDNYPRALFMPCNAHTLNLVVNDAAKVSFSTVDFFSNVSAIYNYFSGSPFRWQILKKHVKSLTVKQVSVTRWESRIKAIRPLRHELGEIYDSLIELAEECSTPIGQHEAKCLAMKIKSYKFICSTVIWYEILEKLNVKVTELTTEVMELKKENIELKRTVDNQKQLFKNIDSKQRMKNIIVFGIPEENDEDVEKKFITVIQEKLQINVDANEIDDIFRLGIKSKIEDKEILAYLGNFDIVMLEENWLSFDDYDKQFLPCFVGFHKCKLKTNKMGRQPGGVAIYVNKKLLSKVMVIENE